MKERNINLDLIRVVAIFSVIAVHFIRNIGFYGVNIFGIGLSIAVFFRTLFMICVPLFLLLTGYLMNKKSLSKKYYIGIVRIIYFFVIAKIVYLIINWLYFKEINSLSDVLLNVFNYENDYSWYINMYLGLFLIIPFLNLIYNNLANKKQKQFLILILIILGSLSSLNFKITIIPNWWQDLYPIMYYFIGVYICEFGFNLKKSKAICYFLVLLILSSLFYIFISYDKFFIARTFNDYCGPINLLMSALIFGIFLNLNISKCSKNLKNGIILISKYSLGMYLFSYIIDKIIYFKLNSSIIDINIKFRYFFIIFIVFIVSFCLSYIFGFIYDKFIYFKNNRAFSKNKV